MQGVGVTSPPWSTTISSTTSLSMLTERQKPSTVRRRPGSSPCKDISCVKGASGNRACENSYRHRSSEKGLGTRQSVVAPQTTKQADGSPQLSRNIKCPVCPPGICTSCSLFNSLKKGSAPHTPPASPKRCSHTQSRHLDATSNTRLFNVLCGSTTCCLSHVGCVDVECRPQAQLLVWVHVAVLPEHAQAAHLPALPPLPRLRPPCWHPVAPKLDLHPRGVPPQSVGT